MLVLSDYWLHCFEEVSEHAEYIKQRLRLVLLLDFCMP